MRLCCIRFVSLFSRVENMGSERRREGVVLGGRLHICVYFPESCVMLV